MKETYNEIFNISLVNMQIRIVRDDGMDNSEMTKKFDYNVKISLAGFVDEYKYLYGGDIRIDTTIILQNYISPIIFRMSNWDYNLVMKCIFHNVTYDDGCDRFLVHNWAQN